MIQYAAEIFINFFNDTLLAVLPVQCENIVLVVMIPIKKLFVMKHI